MCSEVYKITDKFPKDETYGIISQIRRACVAIPSNIAEGHTRGHKQEYIQFLRIAFASGAELETQLIISQNIGYLDIAGFERINTQLEEIMRMLNGLINKLLVPKT